jgi:lambda repressor-like predicted transcriptional regulator
VPRKAPLCLPRWLVPGSLLLVGWISTAGEPRTASVHWAYQPLGPGSSAHPSLSHPQIDLALNQAAAEAGLAPAGRADPLTLCRRLHLVLTGLPPTPEEVDAFLRDPSPGASAARVERLLASPAFGERWARHWLDVVRYADSVTLRGLVFQEAWRYRDYVIDAFNRDLPIDQFIREQIAGALLPAPTVEERQRQLIASTFWVLGDTNLEEQDKRQLELDVIDEQLDVVGKALLGQTIACARCHDHKFDPIPARDYHALAGILSGSRILEHANVSGWTEVPLPGTDEEERQWAAAETELRQAETALRTAKAATNPPVSSVALKALESRLATTRVAAYRPRAMAPVETGATNLPVLRRGNWRTPGEPVPRGVLGAAFQVATPEFAPQESGRRELADWLVHPDNPLTARVFVNRTWHWIFGAGLVRTTDNFGTTGELPSHPRLLDTLARDFQGNGWSLKHLVRQLVLTDAFQRSSEATEPRVAAALAADPANRWLGRFASRRLEAEVIRDTLLRVGTGLEAGGRGHRPMPRTLAADFEFRADSPRRSLYLPVFRNARPEGLTVFDAADPSRVSGVRETSTVAPQALYLLNHPFVHRQARAAAQRVASEPDPIGTLWRQALGRPPAEGERTTAAGHLGGAGSREDALTELALALFGTLDFRTLY